MHNSPELSGALRFMQEDFAEHKDRLAALAHEQSPHTLYIGCCDSRVVPNLLLQAQIGELFVVRNIANIIMPYGSEKIASSAAIEYALEHLKVRSIVICGHSNCGGCKDLSPHEKQFMPNVVKWLEHLAPIKEQVDRALELSHMEGDAALRSWMIERANVVASYENLLTYPNVKSRLKDGSLIIRAWYFVVGSALMMQYDPQTRHFKPLKELELESI